MHCVWTGPVISAAYPSGNDQALHREGVWWYAVPPGASQTHLFVVGSHERQGAVGAVSSICCREQTCIVQRTWWWLLSGPPYVINMVHQDHQRLRHAQVADVKNERYLAELREMQGSWTRKHGFTF